MAFDMRGELFGNREELMMEHAKKLQEILPEQKATEIDLVDSLRSQNFNLKIENAHLKAQLTWRPVSEKPEKIDYYLIRRGSIWFKAYFDGERFRKVIDQKLVAVIGTHWLPIPPPEGDKQ